MKITLALSGSISAYKMIDLAKDWKNQGHEVTVLMTESSKQFIHKQLFKYFNILVYDTEDDFSESGVLHVDIAKNTDLFVLCPLSANTLTKIAQGMADNIVTTTFLALPQETVKVLIPAMNTKMWINPITQKNCAILKSLSNLFIYPVGEGLLACGDEGSGKLPNLKELMENIPLLYGINKTMDKTVVITAGATIAPLDSIRYITNPAKGATSYILAKEFLMNGYTIKMIRGKYSTPQLNFLREHPNYSEEIITTTQDLLNSVKRLDQSYAYISPMAVSDIEFSSSDKKLKKKDLNKSLEINIAPDVLNYSIKSKKFKKIIGFAAETKLTDEVLSEKIKRKPVDLLVANEADGGLISGESKGFGTRRNKYKLLNIKEEVLLSGELSKEDIVDFIFSFIHNS